MARVLLRVRARGPTLDDVSNDTDNDSDEPTEVMFCATAIMRSPPVRIARIGPNFTLPRTVALSSLLAGGAGALLGIAFVVPIVGAGIQQIMYAALFGGGAAIFAINYSPLAGEPLLRWVGLTAKHRRRRLEHAGRHVKVYVGAAQLGRLADGPVRLVPSAVNVAAGAYDERGALRTHRNRNLDTASPFTRSVDVVRGSAPSPASGLDLPAEDAPSDGRFGQWRKMSSQRTLDSRMDAFRALGGDGRGDGATATAPDSDGDMTTEADQDR